MALDVFRFFRCSCEMSGIGSEIDESAESRIWRDAYYTLESSCLPSGKVRQWLRFHSLTSVLPREVTSTDRQNIPVLDWLRQELQKHIL